MTKTASPATSGIELIQEIALTNQISVPWNDLRKVLQDRLDAVLESRILTYTSPTTSNPLSIKLTAVTDLAPEQLPRVSPSVSSPVGAAPLDSGSEEQASSPASTSATTDTESEQDTNQASDPAVATTDLDGTQAPRDYADIKDSEAKESSSRTSANTEAGATVETLAQEETTGKQEVENGEQMVPISKNTLLLETPEGYHARINGLLNTFTSAPFTMQRVCELLAQPDNHHSSLIKYLRAVEKVLMITSSINEFSNPAYNGTSALDGEEEEIEASGQIQAVNGDYSNHELDFSLLTSVPTTPPQPNEEDDAEENPSLVATGSVSVAESESRDADSSEEDEADSSMELEKEGVASTSDMEVDGTNMEGIETVGKEEETNDIHVDGFETVMELDQA